MFPIPNYQKKEENVASLFYIKPDDDIKKSFNGKIKVSVRKLLKFFGKRSKLIMRVSRTDCR